jgi:hypothetical protein
MTRKEEGRELIYKAESSAIIGDCFAVYKDKGCGLALLLKFGHYPLLEYERLLPRKNELPDVRL